MRASCPFESVQEPEDSLSKPSHIQQLGGAVNVLIIEYMRRIQATFWDPLAIGSNQVERYSDSTL